MIEIDSTILYAFLKLGTPCEIEYLSFEKDGLHYNGRNDESTIFVDGFLSTKYFTDYNINNNINLKVNLKQLASIFEGLDETVTVSVKGKKASFRTSLFDYRVMVEEPKYKLKKPTAVSDVVVKVGEKVLAQAVDVISKVGEHVELVGHKKGLYASAFAGESEILVKIPGDIEGEGHSTYQVKYLKKVVNEAPVVLKFGTNSILCLEYELATYYIAPVV